MARFTDEEVDQANGVDILSICQNNDIPYEMEGNRYARLIDHDSLLIDLKKNEFYWNSRQISGGAIDFVKTYVLDNNDFRQSVSYLLDDNKGKAYEKHTDKEFVQEPFVYDKTKELDNIDRARAYLKDIRKISDQTINEFQKSGVLVEDKYHNAVFKWLDSSRHNVIGASNQGTIIDHEKYGKRGTWKGIQKNSTTAFGITHVIGSARNLKFFESAIDMMSYRDLHPELKDTMLVSMEGLKPQVVYNYVAKNIRSQKRAPDSITICVDDDKAGHIFYDRMAQTTWVCQLDGKTVSFDNELCSEPGCKDYNDELVKKVELAKEQEQSNEKQQETEEAQSPFGTSVTHVKSFEINFQPEEHSTAEQPQTSEVREVEKSIESQKAIEETVPKSNPEVEDKSKQNKSKKTDLKTELKGKMNEILTDIKGYSTDPKKYLEMLKFMSKFYTYSTRNQLLITHQRPGAEAVASFKKIKDLGYSVKKGEKGIRILTPVQVTTFERNGKIVRLSRATPQEKQRIKAGQIETDKNTFFKVGNVFDVTQTNMPKEKYPELYPNRHVDFDIKNEGDQKWLDQQLGNFAQNQGIKVFKDLPGAEFSNRFGNAKGVCVNQKDIYLNPANTPGEMTTVLIHELAHSQLHSPKEHEEREKPMRELQAELTSYLVADHFEIDEHNFTVNYLASWTDNGQKLNELGNKEQFKVLDGVSKTAKKMIESFDTKEQDRGERKMTDKSKDQKNVEKKQQELTKEQEDMRRKKYQLELQKRKMERD